MINLRKILKIIILVMKKIFKFIFILPKLFSGILIIIVLISLFTFLQKYYKNKNTNFINSSYDEGSIAHTIEIKSKKKIEDLESNDNLESYYFNKEENSFNYRLIFSTKSDVDKIKTEIENNDSVQSIDIKYVI